MEALANFARESGFQVITRASHAKTTYLSCRRGRQPSKGRSQENVSSYLRFTKCPYSIKLVELANSHFVVRIINSRHNHAGFPEGFEPPTTNANVGGNPSRPNKRSRPSADINEQDARNTLLVPGSIDTTIPASRTALRPSATSDISDFTVSTFIPTNQLLDPDIASDSVYDDPRLSSSYPASTRKRLSSPTASTVISLTAAKNLLALSIDSESGTEMPRQAPEAAPLPPRPLPKPVQPPDRKMPNLSTSSQSQVFDSTGSSSPAPDVHSKRLVGYPEIDTCLPLSATSASQRSQLKRPQSLPRLTTQTGTVVPRCNGTANAHTVKGDRSIMSASTAPQDYAYGAAKAAAGPVPKFAETCSQPTPSSHREGSRNECGAVLNASVDMSAPFDLPALLRSAPTSEQIIDQVKKLSPGQYAAALEFSASLRTALLAIPMPKSHD